MFDVAPFAQVVRFRGNRRWWMTREVRERERVMEAKNVAVGQKIE